jgi:N-acetylneuraminic acid mutarotase
MKHLKTLNFVIASVLAAAAHGNEFAATGNLTTPRYNHTATLLADGRVLAAGGAYEGFDTDLSSAELYDPASGTWSSTGGLASARESHTATMLPNGKVLVAGGVIRGGYTIPLAGAELYEPATGKWSSTGSLSVARYGHTATLLPNGKVLVVGGDTSGELYNPAAGTWSSAGLLAHGRAGHTATLLANGKVLIAGGGSRAAELYNPTNGTWSLSGSLITLRTGHTATLLADGKVLVAGGQYFTNGSPIIILSSSELYDPATGAWSATGSLTNPRYSHTASLLPDGKVLVAGGYNSGTLSSVELYNPTTGNWSSAGDLEIQRYLHTATSLADRKVLFAGGVGLGSYLNTAEMYLSSLNPIVSPTRLADGSFQFGFSNPSGPSYQVLASPDLAAPFNTWLNLGLATETAPGSGQFQFIDHQAANYPKRFYRVTSP